MKQLEKQAYLITDEKQRLYFTGFSATEGYVTVYNGKTSFVVDARYFSAAKSRLQKKGIEVILGSDYEPLKTLIKGNGIERLGIDYGKTTVSEKIVLDSFGVELFDSSREIEQKMAVKSDEELKNIAKACKIAEKAFCETIQYIKEGVTERQVANELEYNFKRFGASDKSFDTIVAFGKNAAVPHHETDGTKLKKDECVLMDFGCLYNGYCSDITRTLFYGSPSKQFLKAYNAVLSAQQYASENIVSGMTGKEADALARGVLTEANLGEYFTHSLGHGIGVNIHEYPRLSQKCEAELKDGMVFSIEPGVYLDGKFGIRIEDTCILENGKVKSLIKTKKTLIKIKTEK